MPDFHLYENKIPQELSAEWAERNQRYKKSTVKGGDTVLVLGCSSGYGTKTMRFCVRVDAVDKSKEAIEYAKANYGKHPSLHFHWSLAESFLNQAPDRFYKVVVCIDMLHENQGEEENLIKEMVRVTDRVLYLGVRPTPKFSQLDADAIIRRLRPKVNIHKILNDPKCPLTSYSNL